MTAPLAACPYVGLQPYTEEQHDFFFGRTRDTRVIVSNLYASPLTVLYGDSGVGKSSVLLAGVVPRLKADPRTAVVVFREWHQPQAQQLLKLRCLEAVTSASGKRPDVPVSLTLDDFLFEVAARFRGTTLLILDQFEEYFLYNPPSAAEDSLDAGLARAINRDEVQANFLIALREDGLAKLDRFRVRIPQLLSNTLRLRHLDADAAEEAIREPLRVHRERSPEAAAPTLIEPELVAAVLSQVRRDQVALHHAAGTGSAAGDKTKAHIETPYLQLVMTRLWEEEIAAQSGVLRLATLQALGGAGQIARTYLDGVMEQIDATGRELCSRFFDRLVTPSGSKIAQSTEDLTNYAGDLTGDVAGVLKKLGDSRILRSIVPATAQAGGVRYEIFHDVIGAAILDWRRRFLARKAAIEAEQRAAAELEIQRQEVDRTRQLCSERERAAEERIRAARKIRRLTALASGTVLIAVLAGVGAWTSLSRMRQAEAQRRLAQEQQALADTARTEAETRSAEANRWAEAARHLADEANTAARKAQEDTEQARRANQAVVEALQAQLEEARRLIETYSQQAGANAKLAREYLDQAKQAQAELDKARANAQASDAKATKARETAVDTERRRWETENKAAAAREGANELIKQTDMIRQMQKGK